MNDISNNPAVQAAQDDGITTLSTGVRARLCAVGGGVIDKVTRRIPEPEIPMWHNADKGVDEPNPNDPVYIQSVQRCNNERALAALDAMMILGVELVDGVPEDNKWVRCLKMMDIEFNVEDPDEREFAYKKYVAVGAPDYPTLANVSGATEEAIRQAARGFRR